MQTTALPPAIAASMAIWHEMVSRRDLSALASITRPDVIFRSPAVHAPYSSAPVLALILETVLQVFEDFTYHREFLSDDGMSVVLEFSAKVAGRDIKGIDMIRFDAQGHIAEFEVMVRPLSGLQALAAAMGERLGPLLQAAKKA